VSEGSEGVARKLLRDDVVLLVLLVGVEGLCSFGSTARPSGRRSLRSPALRGMMLGCRKAKLDGSVSCRESRRCSRSAGLGMGSGVRGCQREASPHQGRLKSVTLSVLGG
jgi:hypothetical protein